MLIDLSSETDEICSPSALKHTLQTFKNIIWFIEFVNSFFKFLYMNLLDLYGL